MPTARRIAFTLMLVATMLAQPGYRIAMAQADEVTCDDFTNQEAAQIVLELDDSFEDMLDEDGDGEACPDLPSRDDDGGDTDDDPAEALVLGIGYPRDDFEDENGEPSDDRDEDDFATGVEYEDIGGYDAINIFWIDDTAAHIVVTLSEELDEDDALDAAMHFLPTSADMASRPDELDDGELLYTGHVDALETVYDEEDFEEYEVGGEPGDVRIILIPGDDDFTTLDIAIGLGEEYGGGGSSTGDDPTEEPDEPDADAEEYLQTVRDSSDQFVDEIDIFNELFFNSQGELTDSQIDDLVDILVHWSAASSEATVLTVPEGSEDIQATFEEATEALENVATEFSAGEDVDLEAGAGFLADAETAFADLDELLTDAGV